MQGIITEHNKSKIEYLSELLQDKLLLVGTESHLNSSILDEEIQIDNFNSHRTDRQSRTHGGIVIYTHNSLIIDDSKSVKFSNSVCELLIIKEETLNLHIICVYRPSDTRSEEFQPCLNNSYYYHRQENKLSGTETDSRFFLARGR